MIDILQLYVSGFWVWLGLTIGLAIVVKLIIILVAIIRFGSINSGD